MERRVDTKEESQRVCTKCRQAKAPSEFHHFGKDRSRIGKWCEDCYQRHGTGNHALPTDH
jgi:hypothetical protein